LSAPLTSFLVLPFFSAGGGLLSGIPFLAVKGGLPAILTMPSTNAILMTLGYTALGAAATIWLRESWQEVKDPVRGAAYVGERLDYYYSLEGQSMFR
jgi:hypothetical protein